MRTVTKAAACSVAIGAIAVVGVGCGTSSTSYNAPTVTNSAVQTNSQGQTETVTTPAAAAAQGGSSSGSTSSVTINSATVGSLGTILVNSQGQTLYMFVPDNKSKVTCVGGCAAVWPPVSIPAGQKATASGTVKQALLGSDPNPSGGDVVTYNGWPLYTYITDTSAGQATGQGVNLNGGLWYVMSPSGAIIKTAG